MYLTPDSWCIAGHIKTSLFHSELEAVLTTLNPSFPFLAGHIVVTKCFVYIKYDA